MGKGGAEENKLLGNPDIFTQSTSHYSPTTGPAFYADVCLKWKHFLILPLHFFLAKKHILNCIFLSVFVYFTTI